MFRLRFADGGELVLTEAGAKKRAGVWLLRPEAVEAELAHLGPEADTLTPETLAPILAADSRRLHSLLRDQRAIAGIGRAWANEILNVARLSPYALSTSLDAEETERLANAIRSELERGLELRLENWDVVPDILTVAKGINSGYVPLGAMIVRKPIADWVRDKYFAGGLTYSGHPLACASAVASIEAFKEEGIVETPRRWAASSRAARELQEKHPSIGDVRGLGCFWGIELVKNRETREPLVRSTPRAKRSRR